MNRTCCWSIWLWSISWPSLFCDLHCSGFSMSTSHVQLCMSTSSTPRRCKRGGKFTVTAIVVEAPTLLDHDGLVLAFSTTWVVLQMKWGWDGESWASRSPPTLESYILSGPKNMLSYLDLKGPVVFSYPFLIEATEETNVLQMKVSCLEPWMETCLWSLASRHEAVHHKSSVVCWFDSAALVVSGIRVF